MNHMLHIAAATQSGARVQLPTHRRGLCVSRVYTDLAVFVIEERGVVVPDLFRIGFDELQELVDVPLLDGTDAAG